MGELVLHKEVKLNAGPSELCGYFGQGDPSLGWLFGSEASALQPGVLVRLAVPLAGLPGVGGTARILSVRPNRQIVLAHESPWTGQVDCRLQPLSTGGTRVRLRVTIDEEEIARLGTELGLFQQVNVDDRAIPLGLLTCLSGSAGILGRSTVNCAELAIEEVNADGGILGRPVRLVVADDATNSSIGRVAMRRLLAVPNLAAVVGMHSSDTFKKVSPLAIQAGIPYLYTPTSEVKAEHPLLVCSGESPLDQLHRALPMLARETGGTRWFFAGNDYSWPHALASTARRIVEMMGGVIVGEEFSPVGTRRFDRTLDRIRRGGAEIVVAGFVGEDHVRFERDFVASGLRQSTVTFAPLMDDAVVEHLGETATDIWNVLGYFQGLETQESRAFLARYRNRFGQHCGPVSAAAEGVYEAVHKWSRACIGERSTAATAVLAGLQNVRFEGPRLSSVSSVPDRLLLGQATASGMRILDEIPGAVSSR